MCVNNSIKPSLNKESMLAEIRMQLSSPQNINKTFIILEGNDDVLLFETLLNSNGCILYESYGGKEALNETVAITFNDSRVIGIRDIDYDLPIDCDRLFYCDHCNAEMMMISNDLFFAKTMRILIKCDDNFLQLRDETLNCLKYFSFTRKQNDTQNWGITFSNISTEYLLSQSCPIQIEDIVKTVNKKSAIKIDISRKNSICSAVEDNKQSLLDYTNGHDFCSGLKCMIKIKYRTQKPLPTKANDQDLRTILTLGYTPDFFRSTYLYKHLETYQINHNLQIVFSHP